MSCRFVPKASALALALAGLWAASAAQAAGSLVMYCGVQEEWCRAVATAFERETGISVAMTRKSAGEVYAQVKAEAANPKGDIWWGGTGDPHQQAAEEGLTIDYKGTNFGELYDWAQLQWTQTKGRTVGIYSGALGFGYNAKLLKAKGLPEPKCWADLVNPAYKDEIQVADPHSSGTAYNLLATIVQIMGDEKGFDYLKALHKNINQYTKSGAAPAQAVNLGETTIGITFMHDMITAAQDNPDIMTVAPCEGTGYEIGSMSLIKGAHNLDNAKKFYDWALTPAAQALAAQNKSFQTPSNKATPLPKLGVDLSKTKLISYDFAKYGSSAVRNALLKRWTDEVKSQPR
ncbi:iron(III) transport system substrate-binding protein [Rhizobiales bacterium GAS191]|nr:iron(III) transport system substrate-binding protein [Rhizobiales bacterium GAS191]